MNARTMLAVLTHLEPVLHLAFNAAQDMDAFMEINQFAGEGIRALRSIKECDQLTDELRAEAESLIPGLRGMLFATGTWMAQRPEELVAALKIKRAVVRIMPDENPDRN